MNCYMRFRIEILNSSVQTDTRLFDVETRGRVDASLEAAATVCGKPFEANDFKHESVFSFLRPPHTFAVKHKRLEALKFKFRIEPV